jgi:hypothetical protein
MYVTHTRGPTIYKNMPTSPSAAAMTPPTGSTGPVTPPVDVATAFPVPVTVGADVIAAVEAVPPAFVVVATAASPVEMELRSAV